MSVAFTYPSTCISSIKVYVSSTNNPSILWGLSPETQVSTTFPSLSFTVKVAPSSSFSPVMSVLLISTQVV